MLELKLSGRAPAANSGMLNWECKPRVIRLEPRDKVHPNLVQLGKLTNKGLSQHQVFEG